jgi:hypothetical protein
MHKTEKVIDFRQLKTPFALKAPINNIFYLNIINSERSLQS